ncbi:hypothetical protein PENTCL1PPCAC_8011, partial [Pristionchus entomophagus]
VVECSPPVRVIGDLHGSLDDLLYIYHLHNVDRYKIEFVSAHIAHSFVFLGNYVDYGEQSLEVLMLLFSMKISSQTGLRKWQANDLFDKFNDIFNHMPLACVIGSISTHREKKPEEPQTNGGDFIIELG